MQKRIKAIVNNYLGTKKELTNSDIVKLESLVGTEFNTNIITPKTKNDLKNKRDIINYLIDEIKKSKE